jgi:hypothetical protein
MYITYNKYLNSNFEHPSLLPKEVSSKVDDLKKI